MRNRTRLWLLIDEVPASAILSRRIDSLGKSANSLKLEQFKAAVTTLERFAMELEIL
jgi:hypothetical protein